MGDEAAKLFFGLEKANASEKCLCAGLSHASLEEHLHVHSPFLRTRILSELQLSVLAATEVCSVLTMAQLPLALPPSHSFPFADGNPLDPRFT